MSEATGKFVTDLGDAIRAALRDTGLYVADQLYSGTPSADGLSVEWASRYAVLGSSDMTLHIASDTPQYSALKQDLEIYQKGYGLGETVSLVLTALWDNGLTPGDLYYVQYEEDTHFHHYHMSVSKVETVKQ